MLAAALWLAAGAGARAQDVVLVLSSGLGPYQEARAGLEQRFGHPVPTFDLSQQVPRIDTQTRVVIALGSKAALARYPEDVSLVYSMAPGTRVAGGVRRAVTAKIAMQCQPQVFLTAVKRIHPELRRLAVLRAVEVSDDYNEQLVAAASRLQVEVLTEELQSPDELPDRLRALVRRKAEALWLPPDPLLINAQSIAILRDFSWANDVPFYAPTAGFAESGAAASIATSFRQIGVETAEVAQRILAGQEVPAITYPHELEITLSLSGSSNAGLRLPAGVVSSCDKVVP